MEELSFIDLFCGIGSFHYSFKKLNWKCVMASDVDQTCRKTYELNHNIEPLGDITEIEPNEIKPYDILCAGFPCQPFSQCGKHLGFDDPRGSMFFQVLKFIKTNKPNIVILENVKGLLSHNGGETIKEMIRLLNEENYETDYKVLCCSDYGIPQMRKRLFLIGISKNHKLVKNIKNILNLDEYKKNVNLSEYLQGDFEKETAYTIRCGGRNSKINNKHNWDGYIRNGEEYRLTIQDCLKLQGYNEDFKLCGNKSQMWKQLGNTIPTIFTELIGLNIKKYL